MMFFDRILLDLIHVNRNDQMDKASIIKDAIDYIVQLQDQERQMQAEISALESLNQDRASSDHDLDFYDDLQLIQRKKKKKRTSASEPIQVIEVNSLSKFLINH